MRVLVTGSREWNDYDAIADALRKHLPDARGTVVHGAARGADRLAAQWAKTQHFVHEEPHPADWDRFGKSAGYRRNEEMARLGADICLAFTTTWPATTGTGHMIDIALHAGIPVRVYVLETRRSFTLTPTSQGEPQ